MFSKFFIALVASAISVVAAPAAAPGLSLKVTGPSTVDGVQNLRVVATVTNTGTETLKLLNDPRGVLNDSPTNTFAITNSNGVGPNFMGIKVKYVPETVMSMNQDSFFTVLEPGQTIDVTHDLSSTYDFVSSGEGDYKFEPSNVFQYMSPNGGLLEIIADHQPTNLKLSGLLSKPVETAEGSIEKRATFVGCSASQQSDINTAVGNADKYSENAYQYLDKLTSGKSRYTTWFGTYDTGRVGTVKDHFNKIRKEDLKNFTFDCSTCTKEDTYAYVYPDTFGKIYLCPVFWSSPATGTDSKAGTLVHESSHFTKNGGTQDVTYGKSNCESLAKSDPASAITNADSHEYFAENTPALA